MVANPDMSDPEQRRMVLQHALGESTADIRREDRASGVMMIPIPARGVFKAVHGVDAARTVPGIQDVVITAKDLSAEDHERLNGYVARVLQKGALSRETLLGQVRDLISASTHHGRRTRNPA